MSLLGEWVGLFGGGGYTMSDKEQLNKELCMTTARSFVFAPS